MPNLSRRRFLVATAGMASGVSLLRRHAAANDQQALRTYNGDLEPYPIPWLDKNGSHNQHLWRENTSPDVPLSLADSPTYD